MYTYHKIESVYKRDPKKNYKTLLEGQYSTPEFLYLKNNMWTWTEKVDGTNTRVMYNGEAITFGGKSDKSQIPSQLVNNLNARFLPRLDFFGTVFNKDLQDDCQVCLYGEGHGEKIQRGGGNYCKGQDFVLFDIRIGEWWLQRSDVELIAEKLEIGVVPIVGAGTLDEMVEYARAGFNSAWGNFLAEGIVARPCCELKTRGGLRVITKIKYKDFIIKEGDAND